MKRIAPYLNLPYALRALPAFAAMVLLACASLGVPAPQSFNEKEAAAISTVTAIRGTALSLLQSGKITAGDAQNIQTQADTAREGIEVADQIHAANPEAGGDRLTAIITGLNAISAYLATRGH